MKDALVRRHLDVLALYWSVLGLAIAWGCLLWSRGGPSTRVEQGIACAFLGGGSVLGILLSRWERRRDLAGLTAQLAQGGKKLWSYTPAEWESFARADWGRSCRRALWWPLLFGGALALYLDRPDRDVFGYLSGHPALVLAGLVGVALGVVGIGLYDLTARSRRVGFACFTWNAVYFDGVYQALGAGRGRLERIALHPGSPACVELSLRNQPLLRVPVPAGKEAEAHGIVRLLGGRE